MNSRFAVGALLLATSFQAVAQDRFVSKVEIPTGETVVVAEGDCEPRSIGSFSVRVYKNAPAGDQTTFFTSGLVRARDGVVEEIILANIDKEENKEVIVTVRSVGTGNHLSAHAFSVAKEKLVFLGMVSGLAADADPIPALRKSMTRGN